MKRWVSVAILVAASAGCAGEPSPKSAPPPAPAPAPTPAPVPAPMIPLPPKPAPLPAEPEGEPERITVQHVLIAFKGSARAPATVTRTREEAKTFALEILERAKKGEDIAKLAADHSTDPGGGKYTLVNDGVDAYPGEIRRSQFIKPFVEVAFKLKVGESGLVEYDSKNAPFGWHIIKRLQ